MRRIRFIWAVLIGIMTISGKGSICMASEQAYLQLPDTVKRFMFHFRFNDNLLLKDYRNNEQSLVALGSFLSDSLTCSIDTLYVYGSYSPEGPSDHNERLALKRAQAIQGYLYWKHPHTTRLPIVIETVDMDWQNFADTISKAPNVPHREQVLRILRAPTSNRTKEENLRLLPSDAFLYFERNMLRDLRNAGFCAITFRPATHATDTTKTIGNASLQSLINLSKDNESNNKESHNERNSNPNNNSSSNPNSSSEQQPTYLYERRPLLALKTNLLFDLATLINLEIELPIGQRWSVAAEWICPWWLNKKKQHCLQVLSGNLEGRYWLGQRANPDLPQNGGRQPLHGWFVGLYAGGGLYDLEWEDEGYQGEFFIAAGLSAGYAHRIGRNLSLEYSLGVGYLQTDYKHYLPKLDGDVLAWQEDGRYTWMGPTRAKISLVWMLNRKIKKGGSK